MFEGAKPTPASMKAVTLGVINALLNTSQDPALTFATQGPCLRSYDSEEYRRIYGTLWVRPFEIKAEQFFRTRREFSKQKQV